MTEAKKWTRKTIWAVIGGAILVGGFVLAVAGYLFPNPLHFGEREKKPGHLRPIKPPDLPNAPTGSAVTSSWVISLVAYYPQQEEEWHYRPFGNQRPTIAGFDNDGEKAVVIQKVEFIPDGPPRRTPKRPNLAGAGVAVPVNFYSRHHVGNGRFVLAFQRPVTAEPGDYVSVEAAIIEPRWVGNTYTGTIKVFYNGTETTVIRNVELDVLRSTPPKPEMRK